MSTTFEEKNNELQLITQKYVKELTEIWKRIFDENTCLANLEKLQEHAKTFYKGLVDESIEKEEDSKREIGNLKNEAENLKRLLKFDYELNTQPAGKSLLEVQSELEFIVAQLRKSFRLRQEQINELLLEQELLCKELGVPPRPLLADPLPTPAEIHQFCQHLQRLKDERAQRIHDLSTLRREIKEYLQVLEIEVGTGFEDQLLNNRKIKLNEETFTGLRHMHKFYGEQVQKMCDEIDDMRKNLEELWGFLGKSINQREKLLNFADYTQTTHNMYNEELQLCLALKTENMELYIDQKRREIVEWWDKTYKSEVERSRFSHFSSKSYTDDLLKVHETELENLKQYYEGNKEIFELFAEHKDYCERMNDLEVKASDPGRFTNRGGQLLKEEKQRKIIENTLSKIKNQIFHLIKQYEEREHAQFLVNGENILDVINRVCEKKRQPSGATLRKSPLATLKKGEGNPNARTSPVANRNIFKNKNSPNVLVMPGNTVVRTPNKSPFKKRSVAALSPNAVWRRRRRSGQSQIKPSAMKASNKAVDVPVAKSNVKKIDFNDTYDSFRHMVSPASRSTMLLPSLNMENFSPRI